MNTTISSNGLPQLPLTTTSAENGAAQATTAAPSAGSPATQASDSVQLTDSARALQQASSAHAPIDTQKVEQIKHALATGTYKVDPHAIASKLVSLEGQIGGKK
ncbi:flagellar biosynthesis anti-sigma factor FlgM [Dyella choica]|uniref:Negative regulator of flagellin synthesis n=1 Tax=Dyella choica TaxID=1927959 RepID=A0A432M6H1_9GAMM|nr:flagellar biosynthesis anti-sigma factor FlgM [Dyella choica]RUL76117.1 flagellar biosynthesis anti-sigma factor FlgM [Dyella choica]